MPNVTPNLGLNKPLRNEFVSRQAYVENLELIDQNVAKKSDFSTHVTQVIHPRLAGDGQF